MFVTKSKLAYVLGVTSALLSQFALGQSDFAACLGLVQFIAIDEAVDFNTARDRCVNDFDATLARISNEAEHNFVGEFLANITEIDSDASFWIGVEDVNDVGGDNPIRFTFVDLSQEGLDFFDEFGEFPWRVDQPNDLGDDQNCVV